MTASVTVLEIPRITRTGKLIDLAHLQVSDICWADMAAGLATPRYQGHGLPGPVGNWIYSIAQHSVVLHDYFRDMGRYATAQWALLHDAEEAYLGDIHGPLKHARNYEEHHILSRQVECAILSFVDFDPTFHAREMVSIADKRLAEAEMHVHFGANYSSALASGALGERPKPLQVPVRALLPMTRSGAIALWLSACATYWPSADLVDASQL